jgi:4-hydroxy-tetrahydrodipicolinate synthase
LPRAQRPARPIAQLTAALFRKSNPVPLKHALSLFGLMPPGVRLPLVELSGQSQAELARVLVRMCDEYSEYMIGTLREHSRASRRAVMG